MEDGIFSSTEEGTPQGGLVSPVLANIYLHYVLDWWFEGRFAKTAVLDKQWVKRGKETSRLRPQSGASWGSTAAALLLLARCREREVWHSAPKAERLGAKNEWLDI